MKQGATHLILANLMPAFITFEDTISHIVNKDKTTRCHYIMAYILVLTDIINQWFTVDYVS